MAGRGRSDEGRHRTRRGSATGFTLLEVVVVIIVVGILSAIAAEKFFEVNRDARIAVLKAARAPLASTAELARAKYELTSPPPNAILVQGITVNFSTVAASGYPKADLGFAAAAGLDPADWAIILPNALESPHSPPTLPTEIAFIPKRIAGSPAGLKCHVKYAEPASATASPVITLETGSC